MRLTFFLLLLLTGCASHWDKYPGAYQWGQCAPYARAVVKDLEAHHIEAYNVVYIWRTKQGDSGAHAVVLYKASDGRWALVSNTECRPAYVKGDTLLAMVKSYDNNAVMISDWDMCPLPLEGKSRSVMASWCGDELAGKTMANGKPFNPEEFTCASWDYPLGTRLKVCNKSCAVFLTVTDRGPAKKLLNTRQIDLSRAAFRLLGPLDSGLIGVTVEKL